MVGTEVGPFDNTICKLHLFLLRDLNPTTYWSVESEGQEKQHSPVFWIWSAVSCEFYTLHLT